MIIIYKTPFDIDSFEHLANLISSKPKQLFNFKKYIKLVVDKYPSRILYGLLIIKFSSYQEICRILDIGNMNYVRRLINMFIQEGIVTLVKKKSEDHQIIVSFWKELYPNSPYTPTFFTLTKKWIPAIKILEKPILRNYQSSSFLPAIKIRGQKWDKHHSIIKAQIKLINERKRKSIGKCFHCDRFIMKGEVPGKDYHNFFVGMVCSNCTNKYPYLIRKWNSMKG